MAGTGGRAARAFVRGFAEIESRGAKSRGNAEDQAGDDGNQDREQEHRAIEPNREGQRQTACRNVEKRAERGPSQKQTEDAACEGKKDAFGQQLADEASASSTHRSADGYFPATVRSAGQEEIGDVGAGDEQNETNGADEKQQCRANVFDDLLLQGNDVSAGAGVVDRVLLFEAFGDADHFGVGLFARDARFETANGEDAGMPVAIVGKCFCPRRERQIDIGGAEQFEVRREDADDGVRAQSRDRWICRTSAAPPNGVARARS